MGKWKKVPQATRRLSVVYEPPRLGKRPIYRLGNRSLGTGYWARNAITLPEAKLPVEMTPTVTVELPLDVRDFVRRFHGAIGQHLDMDKLPQIVIRTHSRHDGLIDNHDETKAP